MVTTRSQHRRAGTQPLAAQPLDRMRNSRRWIKRYKPTDTSHRHRLSDRQPKTQTVTSYTRRG